MASERRERRHGRQLPFRICVLALAVSAVILAAPGATQQAAAAAAVPKLVDTPTVVASSYSLPGEPGWDAAIAFHVRNPTGSWMLDVPFRVTLATDTGPAEVTDNSTTERISIAPRSTRLVVVNHTVHGTQPTKATVKLYAPTGNSARRFTQPIDPKLLTVGAAQTSCAAQTIECRFSGELTSKAKQSANSPHVSVALHTGSATGPIVAAGGDTAGIASLQRNTPEPFDVLITGFNHGGPVAAGASPDNLTSLVPETIVDAVTNNY